jgi:ketosteroid isomerase-like protein
MKASAHFTTNLLITDIVGDSASGSAYVFSRATHTNGETVDWMGRYADLYRRIDDKWLIANRRVFALLPDQSFPRPEI